MLFSRSIVVPCLQHQKYTLEISRRLKPLRALQNILSKFVYCRNRTFMRISSCTCPRFGHVSKASAWNSHHKCDFRYCIFSRDYFGEFAKRNWINPCTTETYMCLFGRGSDFTKKVRLTTDILLYVKPFTICKWCHLTGHVKRRRENWKHAKTGRNLLNNSNNLTAGQGLIPQQWAAYMLFYQPSDKYDTFASFYMQYAWQYFAQLKQKCVEWSSLLSCTTGGSDWHHYEWSHVYNYQCACVLWGGGRDVPVS